MKRIISLILVLALTSVALIACGTRSACFTGEWKFSKISTVEINSTVDEDFIAELKQEYGVEDEKGITDAALAEFIADGTFAPCYLNFDKDRAYAYDPIMEREEATWAFYETGENEGFLSVYTDLDVADGNPDPITNPVVIYNAENDTLHVALKYAAFMVTVEFVR